MVGKSVAETEGVMAISDLIKYNSVLVMLVVSSASTDTGKRTCGSLVRMEPSQLAYRVLEASGVRSIPGNLVSIG
jgi:hypothetical protein